MGKLASGLVLTFAVVGSGTSAEAGAVVRLLRLIDIQLRLPQLRAVLRHDLWERRMVPAKLFRAIRPGSPIEQDASAFPLLTPLPAPTGCGGLPSQVRPPAWSRHHRTHERRGRTLVRTLPSHALAAGVGIGSNLKTAPMTTAATDTHTSKFGCGNLACAATNCAERLQPPGVGLED
jgi:hypothetical protein